MIGPFARRSIVAIALSAAGVALLLLLARTEISAGVAAPSGLYVIDSGADGIAQGAPFLLPPEQPLAGGGVFAQSDERIADAQLTVVDLFATWCPPCQQETPVLRWLAATYRDRGVQVVGVSVGELPATVAEYAARYELGYPLLVDVESRLFRAAGAAGIPTKLVLDADGRVLRVISGPLTYATAATLIEELLPTP